MKPLAQTSGSWRSVESITGFGFGASFASSYCTSKGDSITPISSKESRQGASALMTIKMFSATSGVFLSTVTFSRYASGISFCNAAGGITVFHSFVSSVGNEPTVLRQGCPPLNAKGRKLGQCAS